MMGQIEGHPVRDTEVVESILKRQEKIAEMYKTVLMKKGVSEEVATELASEFQLSAKQMLLGRNIDERPAWFPKDVWNQIQNTRNHSAKPKHRAKKSPVTKEADRMFFKTQRLRGIK